MSNNEEKEQEKLHLVCLGFDDTGEKINLLPRDETPSCYNRIYPLPSFSNFNEPLRASLQAATRSYVVRWETMFAPVPASLHFKKVTAYLDDCGRGGSATTVHHIDPKFDIFLLNEEGKKIIRSLLVYLEYSLRRFLRHGDDFCLENISVNSVGEIRVPPPDGHFIHTGNTKAHYDYMREEFQKFKEVIRQMCLVQDRIPENVTELLKLFTPTKWIYHKKFILNHACFWPPRYLEGKVLTLWRICESGLDKDYVKDILGSMGKISENGVKSAWDREFRLRSWNRAACCVKRQLTRLGRVPGSEKRKFWEERLQLLRFIRNLFVHGNEFDDDKTTCGTSTCNQLSVDVIYNVIHTYHSTFISDLAFNLYFGDGASKEIKRLIVS